jgi:hypothetical protein
MTQVQVREKAGALANPALAGSWKFEGDVSDILIPKLLVGQATSKLVQDEKVGFGQIWRSTTGEVLGGKGKPFQAIPLFHFKTWVLSEKVSGKFAYRGSEPFTAENREKPWIWTERVDGKTTEWKREQALNFYVLLPDDIARDWASREAFQTTGELPDTDASLLPCLLQFKSTSYKAGKTLVTHFAKAADFGVPPFVNTFHIDTDKVTGDQNSWFIFKVDGAGKTNSDYLAACAKWREIVAKQNVKVDDSDLTHAEEVDTMERHADGSAEVLF